MTGQFTKALALAKKDFQLDLADQELATKDEFLALLTKVIKQLLDHDFERLLHGLYRIDVDENKVKVAMTTNNVAENIARLIIERELQKVETRKKYSS